ncbi:hypothetical protein WJX79_002857 [Trebouxia sp. C0005]
MKADIEVLHGPLLDQVLGKLECCQDLLRCAAVCKLWLQVASKVQPTSLYLPPLWRCRESPITPQEATGLQPAVLTIKSCRICLVRQPVLATNRLGPSCASD